MRKQNYPGQTMDLTRRRLLATMPPLALGACSTPAKPMADIVLTGGEIHTVDANDRRVSAIAVQANQIIAVGSDDEIAQFVSPETRQFSLDGRTVLPGINDSHLHLLGWAHSRPPFSLDLSFPNAKSIADCVTQVATQAKSKPKGEWILGRGWDQPYFEEGRAPTAQDLDAVSPDHPVALTEFSGHAIWVNSAALKIAGITADTVPPVGGVIVKDEQGQPSGLLFEGAAWAVREVIPAPTAEQNKAALRSAMSLMLANGVTSCTVPGQTPEILRQMDELAAEAITAKLRVTGLVRSPDSLAGLTETLKAFDQLSADNPLWFQLPGVKIMGDGIPTGNKTAWLHEPYVGGGNGSLLIAGDSHEERVAELNRMVDLIHARGLQIGTHVTGDRSIDTIIDAYERVQSAGKKADPRHYIIHGDLVSPETFATMAKYKIGANLNPEIKHLIADGQVAALGAERAAYEFPFRTGLDQGVVVASSSDAPVTEGNWLQGIATCMDRKGKQTGQVSGPEQRISLDDAIRTYTWAGAWQDRADHYKGSLEVGKMADLCVLDERLSAISTEKMASINVSLTLVDGNLVHDELG